MLGGPGALMRNDGAGHFVDVTAESGLTSSLGSTTMTLADVDSDADLDLYVARYKRIAIKDSLPPEVLTWEAVILDSVSYSVKPEFADHYVFEQHGSNLFRFELAEPDELYINDGMGQFAPVDWTGGAFVDASGAALTSVPKDWALTARFHDVNGDGHVDLYVCNDFESEDILWLGDGNGTFRMASPETLRKISNATMSVDFADIDRDGHIDMFLTDMLSRDHVWRQRQRNTRIPIPIPPGDLERRVQEMQNTLFVNRGDGTFAEAAYLAGVAASGWSWSTSFLDVDLDGYEDLLVTTGHVFDIQDLDAQSVEQQRMSRVQGLQASRSLLLDFPNLSLPNVAFRNLGDRTFAFMSDGWGLGETPDISHGMALGDLDGDGDQDVVVNRLNEAVGLYENTTKAQRIAVQLRGPGLNTHGVGAMVRLHCDELPAQQKEITSGGQYVSGSQMMATFAASDTECLLEVAWPGGADTTTVSEVMPGRLYEVAYENVKQSESDTNNPLKVWGLAQMLSPHPAVPYDDFARQPLLPRRLRQRGPGAAVTALDGDDDEARALGACQAGRLTNYSNEA